MSAISKAFADLAVPPKPGYHWVMDATLTGTEQVSEVPAGIFTAAAVPVTYVPGSPATISFNVTRYCKTPPPPSGPPPTFKVTLIQNAGVYRMAIAFPANPGFNCAANVDAASGVTYGSQLAQFVTLVLNPRQEQG